MYVFLPRPSHTSNISSALLILVLLVASSPPLSRGAKEEVGFHRAPSLPGRNGPGGEAPPPGAAAAGAGGGEADDESVVNYYFVKVCVKSARSILKYNFVWLLGLSCFYCTCAYTISPLPVFLAWTLFLVGPPPLATAAPAASCCSLLPPTPLLMLLLLWAKLVTVFMEEVLVVTVTVTPSPPSPSLGGHSTRLPEKGVKSELREGKKVGQKACPEISHQICLAHLLGGIFT